MTATVKPNFRKTSFLYEALKKGILISILNLLGTVTLKVCFSHHPKVGHEPDQVYQVARDGIAKQRII